MLFGTLDATLLGILVTVERLKAKITGKGVIRAGERNIKASRIFDAVLFFN